MPSFLFDLHCHTAEHSHDGKIPARDLLRGLVERGFAGVTLTDHNYCWPDDELAELHRASGIPDAFVLLSGQEVQTSHEDVVWGDLLLYGPHESLPDGADPARVVELAREAGGFCIAPHVGVPRIGFGEHVADFPIAALETWNGRYGKHAEQKALEIAERYALPRTGGSDAHQPRDIGGGGTMFPECPRSLADIGRLIAEGECKPWKPGLLERLSHRMGGR